jgi:hypothetical protein
MNISMIVGCSHLDVCGLYCFVGIWILCLQYRFLRVDALSLLLSLANVTANSDILLVDMVGGLLTGAVAERLGGLISDFIWKALSIL